MRYCRACKKMVAEDAKVCPVCKKSDKIGTFGQSNSSQPAGNTSTVSNVDGETLQFTLGSLERRLEAGKKRSRWLAIGAVLTVILGATAWLWYYGSTVLSYAQLDNDLRVERDPVTPDRLMIVYRPVDTGRLGFGRIDPDRETELVDQVASSNLGEQKFQWRWSGVKTGDKLWVTHRVGWSLNRSELVVPEEPLRPRLGDAVLVGEVVDATNNTPIEGAEIRVVGTPLRTLTDSEGKFRLADSPVGPASIEVSANQFSTDQFEKDLSNSAENDVRVVLSPGMKSGQIRVVLTWGNQPKDLDAHLTGPLPGDRQFHIFFQQKGDLQSKEFVNLDVDDTDGNGPETITILGVLPGKYKYFVHDYTNQGLENSRAQVKLYQGGQTYRFTVDRNAVGTLWDVCEIEVEESGSVKVVKVNKYRSR